MIKAIRYFTVNFVILLFICNNLFTQEIIPRNKIKLAVKGTAVKDSTGNFRFEYAINSLPESVQNVWDFDIIFMFQKEEIIKIFNSPGWQPPIIPDDGPPYWVSWGAFGDKQIKPGQSASGFGIVTNNLPAIVDFYAEGWHPIPSFPEGFAPNSIPGYDDLTPYGPGVVGRTIGPAAIPDPFYPLDFIDTLSSYILQSHSLGWINNTRDDDAEEDENAEDGIVKNLDKRLNKVKELLAANKVTRAKNQLEKFLTKVEKLWARYQKEVAKKKKNPVIIFTSEAYALLKYNGEYLMANIEAQPPPLPASKIQQKSDQKAKIKSSR